LSALPKLKLKVEYAIIGYLIGELTDKEFQARIRVILDEFQGKPLLHKNIGQVTWERETGNRALKPKFEQIWILLDQVSPQIRKAFDSS
jgi:hypothetical protein